jgi:hypothetical protein
MQLSGELGMSEESGHVEPKGPLLGHEIRFNENDYPFWKKHFNEEARAAMVQEDLQAGEFVSLELIVIVAGGVLLGLVGVIASM